MKIIQGDLIKLALQGEFDVIVHGCNCFCTMGAGIAKQIKEAFPEAYEADCWTARGFREKLGSISHYAYTLDRTLVVVNGYTQYDYRGPGPHVDYDAVRRVFCQVKRRWLGRRIGYPKIGAGLAGGDWDRIVKIIDKALEGEDHTLVVLPGSLDA